MSTITKKVDWKYEFDPERFFKSLKISSPSDANYYTLTFEDYLKENDVYEIYEERLTNSMLCVSKR